ncbi:SDR family oxidoreductase [Actinoplanes sp. NPDC051851]|uniref:SDR family NAD(P)-dependent oxidoreductase n=1 Tax=Actinoplanes sp. NPDC051851 TaxID=3154753 RepID=UPI003424F5AC
MRAAGRTLVVTGAGGDIGRAVTLEALRRGARVAAVDADPVALRATAAQAVSANALSIHEADLTDRAAVRELPARIIARWAQIDGVLHCAGTAQPVAPLADLDDETIDRVFAVNWSGTLHVSRAFLPVLRTRPEAHLVTVASLGGVLPVPGQTVYGAAMAAVRLLTEGLHAECAGTNVRVTLALPPAPLPGAATTTPERAARDILTGMERNAYRILLGRDARLMDRLYRLTPRRAVTLLTTHLRRLSAAPAR